MRDVNRHMAWRGFLLALTVAVSALTFGILGEAQDAENAAAAFIVGENVAVPPAPEQPLPYSHKKHAGELGLDCRYCHSGGQSTDEAGSPAAGAMMTFPSTGTCMDCHRFVATDREAIAELTGYHERGEAIPWARVYDIREGVNWSHETHLSAGVACTNCHGDVAAQEVMAKTTTVTAMATCIECHQASAAPDTCVTCHSWPAESFTRED